MADTAPPLGVLSPGFHSLGARCDGGFFVITQENAKCLRAARAMARK
jgi:hypothetical protein